jgi:uncharacterized protein YkwD
MRLTPFTWLIAIAAVCSLAALTIQLVSTPQSLQDLSGEASALPAGPSDSIGFPTVSVTEASLPVPTEVGATTVADTAGIALADDAQTDSEPGVGAVTAPVALASVARLQPDTDLERALLDELNTARFEYGLAGLERYDYLDAVALARAESLAAHSYFDHTAPDGSSAFSELAARGILYRLAGENLARNNFPAGETVRAAFDGLMASPGHRQNILEPAFGAIGLAVVQSGGMWYHVMVFTNPR